MMAMRIGSVMSARYVGIPYSMGQMGCPVLDHAGHIVVGWNQQMYKEVFSLSDDKQNKST